MEVFRLSKLSWSLATRTDDSDKEDAMASGQAGAALPRAGTPIGPA